MRRRLLLLALLLVPSFATAQELGYGRTFIGGTITAPILGPTGCAAPAYSFTGDTNAGLCLEAANQITLQTAPSGNSRSVLTLNATGNSLTYVNGSGQSSILNNTGSSFSFSIEGTQYLFLSSSYLTFGATANDKIGFSPPATGTAFNGLFGIADLSADRDWTMPNLSGTTQLLLTGTAAPSATDCDAANEAARLYHQTGDPATVNLQLFRCTWTGPASLAWHPVAYQLGTSAPATCTVGAVFFDSDATAGSNWFGCTSANTWTVLGGGMGDPGANGIMVRIAANTSVNRTLTCGEGNTCSNGTGVAGDPTVTSDRAVVVFKGSGTADPPATCGDTGDSFQLLDFYLETDTNEIYQCRAVDTWVLVAHVADDSVLVGSGTGLVVEAIPDCDDSGGNHLNYNTTGSAGSRFSCGTTGDGAGASLEPTTIRVTEDFLSGTPGTAGTIGDLGWQYGDIGTGGSSAAGSWGAAGRPGILVLTANGSDNGGRDINLSAYFGSATLAENWIAYLDFQLEDAATARYLSVGFIEPVSSLTTTSAIRLFYDTDLSHTNFIYQICDSSTSGCQSAGDDTNADTVDSGVAASTAAFYRLTIQHQVSGVGGNPTLTMNITGGSAKTFCSSGCDSTRANFPSADLKFDISHVARDTALRRIYLDWFGFEITGLDR